MDREILSSIKKECFQDMEISEEDILQMAKSMEKMTLLLRNLF